MEKTLWNKGFHRHFRFRQPSGPTLDQHGHLGRHSSQLTDRIAALHSLGLHIDRVFSQFPKRLKQLMNSSGDRLFVGRELECLEKNRRIDIDHDKPRLTNTFEGRLNKEGTRLVLPLGITIWKKFPDISTPDRAEQRVGQGMQKNITITVRLAAELGVELDSAKPER